MTGFAKTMAALIGATLLATACATTSGSEEAASEIQTRNRNVLSGEEMERGAGDGADVHEAIAKLRPHFLRQRATSVSGNREGIKVYVGNTPYGGVDALKGLRPVTVRQVRYLTGAEATTLFGTGHGAGALILTLK